MFDTFLVFAPYPGTLQGYHYVVVVRRHYRHIQLAADDNNECYNDSCTIFTSKELIISNPHSTMSDIKNLKEKLMIKAKTETLRELGSLFRYMGDLFESLVEDESPIEVKAEEVLEEPKEEITFEQVRSVLGKKSQEGFTAKVRELLATFGAHKLSEVNPKDYQALLEGAEALKNG